MPRWFIVSICLYLYIIRYIYCMQLKLNAQRYLYTNNCFAIIKYKTNKKSCLQYQLCFEKKSTTMELVCRRYIIYISTAFLWFNIPNNIEIKTD